jgi:hypothetical protein
MAALAAADMTRAPEEQQRYDRMNDHALVGEVTGLALLARDQESGSGVDGDLIVIEVSLVPGCARRRDSPAAAARC